MPKCQNTAKILPKYCQNAKIPKCKNITKMQKCHKNIRMQKCKLAEINLYNCMKYNTCMKYSEFYNKDNKHY